MRLILVISVAIMLAAVPAFGAGDAVNGKRLFNDPALGGSENELTCNSCHSDGARIEHAGTKKYTSLMGQPAGSLEDVVNICIVRPLKGKALKKDSKEMKDIVAYIKSLAK